jgi:uncharacterized membrane protein YeiH
VRDVLCRETPLLLLPGQPYTLVALLASVIYIISLYTFHTSALAADLLAVGGAFAFRSLAAWRGWVTH